MIITRTPFRIPLGGGGTDLPNFYSKYGGFIFSVAINKYMYITVNRPIVDNLIRIKYSKTEIVDSVSSVQHPLVREALRFVGIKDSIEVASIADVPAGTGMGSSSSYLVGLLKALHTLKREQIPLKELAEESCHIELDILEKPIGKQDQYLATFGGFTVLNIDKNGSVDVSQAHISQEVVEKLRNNILLFFTGISRDALGILGEQSANAGKNELNVVDSLKHIKEIGLKIKENLEKGKLEDFGQLLHEHWITKKKMSSKISSPQIDYLYEVARENGATGGKIMGAGGGGFFLFYCEGDKTKLRKVMEKEGLREMGFDFDFEGSKVLIDFLSHGRG